VLHAFKGHRPQVAEGVYIAPGAQVIGAVTLQRNASVWYNAVLRGDTEPISIGEGSNIQDGTVVHTDTGLPTTVGRNVTVGHACVLHGCQIADDCLIGMGATLLNGSKIGANCLVGAGSLITEGKEFPPGSVIMGRPAKVVREVGERELAMIRSGAEIYRQNARLHAAEPPLV
jgi:carbonic anhydrase/acetyltransferase-like protein (isoleucine patch superfamily)